MTTYAYMKLVLAIAGIIALIWLIRGIRDIRVSWRETVDRLEKGKRSKGPSGTPFPPMSRKDKLL